MEYVVGPVLALLIGMKFTDFKSKEAAKAITKEREAVVALVNEKIIESNTQISQQTLRLMTPMAKSVTTINKQLGL